ncbi:MAG: HDOD domain-containing protein [Planctomycetota bacterium]
MTTQAVNGSVLQQFVERASCCYSLPAVAVEVLELTEQADTDPVALRECVERDPALTAKLLRVVNSSLFGLNREVTSLTQALALLGVKPLKLLVLGFSLPKALYTGIEADTLERFWKFTLLKAVAARELSKTFWNSPGDEAFTAGLLQEIGILVLVKELGDSYVNFLARVHERRGNLMQLETTTLGFDHAVLSARLLDRWQLPSQIVEAVATPLDIEHIERLDAGTAALPQTLHLATLLASIIVNDRHDLMAELVDAATRYRNIEVDHIDGLLDQLQEQVRVMADMFSVRFEQRETFHDLIFRAHQQMSEAAMEALPEMIGSRRTPSMGTEQEKLYDDLAQYAQCFLDLTHARLPRRPGESSERSAAELGPAHSEDPATTHATDPGQDVSQPDLEGRIRAALSVCRTRHHELSVILLEIDKYDNLPLIHGAERMRRVSVRMKQAVQSLADTPCECVTANNSRVWVVLPGCERQQAVSLARSFNHAVPTWLREQGEIDTVLSFSAGIAALAMPTRSSQSQDLIHAADRCLFAAQRAGGNLVKSVDVL